MQVNDSKVSLKPAKLSLLRRGKPPLPLLVSLYFDANQLQKVQLQENPSLELQICGSTDQRSDILDWLYAYLEGTHLPFPLVLKKPKEAFSQKVLSAMQKIPLGETRSYRDIAADAESPKAARAVGNICNRNDYPLIIPCHRIVAASGLGGFAYGLDLKAKLLHFERVVACDKALA